MGVLTNADVTALSTWIQQGNNLDQLAADYRGLYQRFNPSPRSSSVTAQDLRDQLQPTLDARMAMGGPVALDVVDGDGYSFTLTLPTGDARQLRHFHPRPLNRVPIYVGPSGQGQGQPQPQDHWIVTEQRSAAHSLNTTDLNNEQLRQRREQLIRKLQRL